MKEKFCATVKTLSFSALLSNLKQDLIHCHTHKIYRFYVELKFHEKILLLSCLYIILYFKNYFSHTKIMHHSHSQSRFSGHSSLH